MNTVQRTLTLTDAPADEAVFVLVLYADGAEADAMAAAGQRLAVAEGVLKIVLYIGLPAPREVVLTATEGCVDLEEEN